MTDFEAHLLRQMAFSRGTYGPGERHQGVIDHIRKELIEVEESEGAAAEWVDVVILALDGLTRRLAATAPGVSFDDVASTAVRMIVGKQGRNERRDWPDWRSAPEGRAIEHVRK